MRVDLENNNESIKKLNNYYINYKEYYLLP